MKLNERAHMDIRLPSHQRYFLRIFAVVAMLVATNALAAEPLSPRVTYGFDSNWRLLVDDPAGAQSAVYDDSAWKPVTLPRAWNEDDAFRKAIGDLPTGIAWYRKHFSLPSADEGKKVYIEFQGVRQAAEVYVNGKSVGLHEDGVMAFGMDITQYLNPAPADNMIAVRTDNSWTYHDKSTKSAYQWNDRNFYANYGGINRTVRLHVMNPLHQTLPLYSNLGTVGVYTYATDINITNHTATISAESEVENNSKTVQTFGMDVTIADVQTGKRIATFSSAGKATLSPGEKTIIKARSPVAELQFWSWGSAYLYDVTTTLLVDGKAIDHVVTRTGFRKTEFKNGALELNNHVMQIHGYAQRTTNEWPALGTNIPAWVSDFSNGLMVEGNANLVRWMHVTPAKQDIESCDRVGLIQSMPAGDSEKDVTGQRWDARMQLMRDAIIYNRNNPSIIFYEAGNSGVSEAHMREMINLRNQYDPHGGRAMGCRNMLESHVAEWGGDMLYVNKSAYKPMWATEFSRDEGLRKYWDEFSPPFHKEGDGPDRKEPAASYNHNQDMHAIENVHRWFDYYEQRPGTGTRVNAGGVNIIFSDSNTHYRGAENYRRSGEVDAMRLTKDAYFANQIMWNGWCDVEQPGIHILGHWNYAAGTTKNIEVISSADKVELQLNGKTIGTGEQSCRFLYTFKNVTWQSGTLVAIGYDAQGREIARDQRQTTGDPVAIKLTPHTAPAGLRADGADVALVDVEVVDATGTRCPTALNPIQFDLKGPAEWRGGIAQAPDNGILSTILPVECGINRVIIRSTSSAGDIMLTATAGGLKSAQITLKSLPVEITNGLSKELAGANLPIHPIRAIETNIKSIIASRKAITPTKITAGANQTDVKNLMDDDETTTWSNDNHMDTAFLQFSFDKPTAVNQMVMRLGSWRTRSYPIRIIADGKTVVFNGVAGRTVGYSTLQFPTITCHELRLELSGAPRNSDAADLVEITGKIDANGTSKGNTKATLTIHELEIYGPVNTTGK